MEQERSWSELGRAWRAADDGEGLGQGSGCCRRQPGEGAAGSGAGGSPLVAVEGLGGPGLGLPLEGVLGSVLVVHADERRRLDVLEQLRHAGLQAFGAASATEALSAHEVHRHAVMIADIELPGFDGAELARRLKDRDSSLAVLLLASPERLALAAASGVADGCMAQPPQKGELAWWARRWLVHDQLRRAYGLLLERIDLLAAHQARFDPLTGLPNRPVLDSRLHEALAAADTSGHQLAVLFVDLDGFKSVNDVLGHHAGDALLKEIAGRLVVGRREGDTVARFGGDEFVVVCPQLADPAVASDIATSLLADLGRPLVADGYEHRVTASIGVAVSGPGCDTPELLLRNADLAMYRAKEDGRSRWALFEEPMLQAAQARYATRQRLRRAVGNGELHLLYQPVVDLHDGSLVGAEALVRWQRPGEDLVVPGEFLDIAEEVGLIRRMGDWVIGQALSDLALWQQGLPAEGRFRLWINLWSRQAADPSLPKVVHDLLHRHNLPADAVGLDIRQAVLGEDAGTDVVRELAASGIAIGIDDFGSGGGDLGVLADLPLALLKLDRRLVARVKRSAGGRPLDVLRAVTGLGLAFGIPVMAKGIEAPEQATTALAVGCSYGQGFLYGTPCHAKRLAEQVQAATPS